MKKTFVCALFFLFLLSGCALLEFDDTMDLFTGNVASVSIQVQDGSKNGVTVQAIDIKQAIFKITNPLGVTQTNIWTPGSNTLIVYQSTKNGTHTLQLIDIDSNNVTNTATAILNLKVGYNYRVMAVLGGSVSIYEVSNTNTNTNTFVFDPAQALVLYSETHAQNVTWGVDINTNEGPSDPNILTFTNQTAGEGSQCFKIKVNSNMFNVNWLRFPLVTYLDLTAYTNGSLHLMIKGTKWISISIHIAENYDIMVHLTNDGLYGYYTNNQWCSVVIPMSDYVVKGVDTTRLYGWLKFYGGYYEGIVGGEEYFIDDVFFYKK